MTTLNLFLGRHACALLVGALIFSILFGTPSPTNAQDEPETQATPRIDFVKQIQPILENHCLKCHGEELDEGGFRVDDRDTVFGYLEAGDVENSELLNYLTSEDEDELMPPPDEGGPLPNPTISLIRNWIAQGADWPESVSFKLPNDPQETVAEPATNDSAPSGSNPQVKSEPSPDANQPTPPAEGEASPAETGWGERVWGVIGLLHPAAVHMPIGLMLAAGLFALLGIRGNFVMSDSAYYCLWLGTLTSIVATVLGWSASMDKGAPGDLSVLWDTNSKHFLHRASGVGVTVFAIFLSLYAARARARDPDDGFLWKFGAILLAIGVSYCGFEGGKITHGTQHYKKLYAVIEELTGWDIDGVPNRVEPDNNSKSPESGGPAQPSDSSNTEVGSTSQESDPESQNTSSTIE